MMTIRAKDVIIPLDVSKIMRENYVRNYLMITRESGRLMLFAGDQKVEHLNHDFFGEGIHPDDADPEHLLKISDRANIGVFDPKHPHVATAKLIANRKKRKYYLERAGAVGHISV